MSEFDQGPRMNFTLQKDCGSCVSLPSPLCSAHLPFTAERVGESALEGPLLAEWDALHARILPNMPFTSASWNALWWKHHRSNHLFKRDELCLIVVRDALNALIAVAPMMSTRRFFLRTLRYFGADPNVTEVRGLVCEPENEVAAIEAVLKCLKREMPAAHWIEWGALRKENWEQACPNLPGAPGARPARLMPITWSCPARGKLCAHPGPGTSRNPYGGATTH